ncbi:MAG: hypothetical protein HGA96_04800 [Desulfobulbaceae bacterium]|nr:hypothetical protein [Desulfobulbaceae bacterium]
MNSIPLAARMLGFGLTAAFAVTEHWSLQEFCWSTWLTGLVYSWVCVVIAAGHIILTAGQEKARYEISLPYLKQVSPAAFLLGCTLAAISIGGFAFYGYSYLFAFYGLFLSVFAEMEPHTFFGRNGFINSDFFTPVVYLLEKFWPMLLGALIANANNLRHDKPWQRILLPFRTNEILRIHLMTLAMPFLALLAWAIFRGSYQPATIVLLCGLFYLVPNKHSQKEAEMTTQTAPAVTHNE